MKKRAISLLLAVALMCAIAAVAAAADTSQSYDFALTVNGGATATVAPGDIVDITLTLTRTDSPDGFAMYAVQANIQFDTSFFELVEDSVDSPVKVSTTDLTGDWRGWVSLSVSEFSAAVEGKPWDNSAQLVTFRLRTLHTGTSAIFNRNSAVSTSDGLDSYEVTSNNIDVVVRNPQGSTTPPVDVPQFTDVPSGAWFEDAVNYVVGAGLFSGTSDTTFSPETNMTRAMMVTVLWRLAGQPGVDKVADFTDVAADQWYTDAVAWASAYGIVGGYGDGRFGTNDSITREQFAAILHRYAVVKNVDVSQAVPISEFTDAKSVSSWALEGVQWAVGAGLMNGTGNNALSPAGTATRAQAATILMRFNTL